MVNAQKEGCIIWVKQQKCGFNDIERRIMDLNGLKRMDNQQEWSCCEQHKDTRYSLTFEKVRKRRALRTDQQMSDTFSAQQALAQAVKNYTKTSAALPIFKEEHNMWKSIQ